MSTSTPATPSGSAKRSFTEMLGKPSLPLTPTTASLGLTKQDLAPILNQLKLLINTKVNNLDHSPTDGDILSFSASLLVDLQNELKVPEVALKKAKVAALPAFASVTWEWLATQMGWTSSWRNFETKKTPIYFLPSSFQTDLYLKGWDCCDVYPKPGQEQSRVRMLDGPLVILASLFQGRVENRPEVKMPGSTWSCGGQVDFEMFILDGALFLIIEMKVNLDDNSVAQLFVEMLSAAVINEKASLKFMPIYGLATDLGYFRFFSYDVSNNAFYRHEYFITALLRDQYLAQMIPVYNMLFSIFVNGYDSYLTHFVELKIGRARDTYDDFKKAFDILQEAKEAFGAGLKPEGNVGDLEWLDEKAAEGLALLQESVRCVHRTDMAEQDMASVFTLLPKPRRSWRKRRRRRSRGS